MKKMHFVYLDKGSKIYYYMLGQVRVRMHAGTRKGTGGRETTDEGEGRRGCARVRGGENNEGEGAGAQGQTRTRMRG